MGDMSTTTDPIATAPAARLLGWDCIELWVGNARAFAGFLMSAFGFRCTAYAGPETGVRDKASYVLEQGDVRFVVSGALTAESPIAAHVRAHGARTLVAPRAIAASCTAVASSTSQARSCTPSPIAEHVRRHGDDASSAPLTTNRMSPCSRT